MIRRFLDLILLLLLTVTVLVLGILNINGGVLMKLAGAVFVMFAPGYAVISAIFQEDALEPPAKIALGIGVSVALSAIGGIGLYGIGAPLMRTSWTIFLTIIIFVAGMVAFVRRGYNGFYVPGFVTHKLKFFEILLLVFCVLTLGSGIYLARTAAKNQAYIPFTEFWVIPHVEDVSEIEVGMRSYESTTMVYEIKILINGRDVEDWPNISISPGQEWSRIYTLPPKLTFNETIVVYLYTDKDPSKPYRWGQVYR
jgi:uncharacterized membrane protein